MSTEALKAIIDGRHLEMQPHHDIESFIWVLGYALMRHVDAKVVKDAETTSTQKDIWHEVVTEAFGRQGLRDIRNARTNFFLLRFDLEAGNVIPIVDKYISPTIKSLLRNLAKLAMDQIMPHMLGLPVTSDMRLTYDKVCGVLDIAIVELSGSADSEVL